MDDDQIRRIALLLRQRNAIDATIAQITGRPVASGHLGEWLAAQIFEIDLQESASAVAFDGRFRSGPLRGKTVNIKWYMAHQGLLATTESEALDYYLVLARPQSPPGTSPGAHRPWRFDAVYLFDAPQLRREQVSRRVKGGVASSVTRSQWAGAQIHPQATSPLLYLTARQTDLLNLFNGG